MHRHLFNNNQKVAPQGLSVVNPQHRPNGVGNFPAPARIGNPGGFARLARPLSGGLTAAAGDGRALRGGHANRGHAAAQADTPMLLVGGSMQENHGDGQRNGDMRLPCGSGTDLSSFKYNIHPYREPGNFADGALTKRYPINELRHINNTSRGAVMLPNCPPTHPATLPMQQQSCGFSPAFGFAGGQPMLEDSLERQQNADEANGRRNIYLPPMMRQQGPQMGPKLPQMHPAPMPGGNPPILPNGNLARPPMLPPHCNASMPLPMNGATLEGRPPIACNGSAMGPSQNMVVMVNPVKPQQQSPPRNVKTAGKRVVSMGVEWTKFWQMSSQPLKELSDLALGGSEICAQMAHSHRSRPCFRKIDSLCARLKQDLMRPPSILSNINSQGMAWAVKDFIFVFTRISSAWVIIKGYLYDNSDGMAKVQATLSPNFPSSFAQWQTSTFHFLGEMIDSVHRLDRLERMQKTPAAAALLHAEVEVVHGQEAAAAEPTEEADSGHSSNGSESSRGSTPRKVDYSVITIKDSDAVQMNAIRNDTYLRAGTYSSIDQKALQVTFPKGIPLSPKDVLLDLTVPPPGYLANGLKAPPPPEGQPQEQPPPPQPDAKVAEVDDVAARRIDTKVAYIKFGLINLEQLLASKSFDGMLQQAEQNDGIDVEAVKVAAAVVGHFASGELGEQFRAMLRQCVQESMKTSAKEEPEEAVIHEKETQKSSGEETDDLHAALIERDQALAAEKINALVMHVVGMKNAEIFFEKSIIHCHFPGFDTLFGPYFSDIHTITQKKNAGDYHNIPLVLHDIRKILYYGRHYLKINEDATLREAIDNYEKDFNEIFKEPPFNGYSYPEIEGKPSEMFLLDRLENRRFKILQ